MSQKLKLTLTLQALESLLGGDSDVEVELRQSIVHEFARRHLKGLIPAACKEAADAVNREVRSEVQKHIQASSVGTINYGSWPRFTLSDDAKRTISEQVHARVNDLIHPVVDEVLKDLNLKKIVEDMMIAKIRQQVKDEIKDKLLNS